ncbi:hypothetical protein [Rhizorhabdus sp.]|uniref:phage head spike fiber domain-containing protein n=1 Tax=Rhizorhabdus sp. TaxID=1968843 RepID=UPI0035B4976F
MSRIKALSTLFLALLALLMPGLASAQNQFQRESSLNNWSTAALDIDFTTGVLDPRITFTRASTATRINAAGLVETVGVNVPRFDHDPVTLAPRGLLVEEGRTNLVLQSANLSVSPWSTFTSGAGVVPVVTANAGISPEGTMTASRVQLNAGGGTVSDRSIRLQTFTTPSGAGFRRVWVKAYSAGEVGKTIIHLVEAVTGQTSTSITLTANWQEITSPFTGDGNNKSLIFECRGSLSSQTADFLVWGVEVQQGAFLTSHIPSGASPGTRSPDQPIISGANFTSWFNPVEGVFLADMERPPAVNAEPFSVWDGANAKGLEVYLNSATTMAGFVADTTTQANMVGPALPAGFSTCALAYKLNDFAFTCNAGTLVVDSTGTVPAGLDRLVLGRYRASATYYNARIRRLRYLAAKPTNVVISGLSARIAQ